LPPNFVQINRNTATIVNDGHRTVRVDGHVNGVIEASHRFVNRVVHYFLDQVLDSSGTGGSDVHSGTEPNGFHSLHDIDISGGVFLLGGVGSILGHESSWTCELCWYLSSS